MNRKRSVRTIIAMAAMMIGATIASAHNGIEHVMGTATAVTDSSITVATIKHTAVTVMVGPSTTFSHKNLKASIKDLKVGERVVINAKEDAHKNLQGISVKWGAGATAAHSAHKP